MEKIKVLVVDDAAFMRDIVKKGLRSQFPGLAVDECATGKQAQSKLLHSHYDLILCDWEMPEMRGDELLEWIRSREESVKLPFVMVTSRGDKDHVVKAVELGVNNYLVKPFTSEKLTQVVTKVLTQGLGITANELALRTRGTTGSEPMVREMGRSGAVPVMARISEEVTAAPAQAQVQAQAPLSAKPTRKVLAQLRFGNATVNCLVKQVDLERVSVVLRRADALPRILEVGVFDFEVGEGEQKVVSRLNGYVHTLQARDDSRETEFVNLVLRFVDDDPEKQAQLRKYIGSL